MEGYRVTHLPSGKAYIGITTGTAQRRWAAHRRAARSGKNVGSRLHDAIRKHGAKQFKVETLFVCGDWGYACEMERRLIAACDTLRAGYNATEGGQGTVGFVPSDETRQKLSAVRLGKPKSPEHRAAISAAKKGKPRLGGGAPWRGKEQPRDMVEKRAASHRGRKNSSETIEKMRKSALAREARKRVEAQ